jgi:flagellar hook-length control protein FliK
VIELKEPTAMMSTLNSSLLNLKNSSLINAPPATAPQATEVQSKRFAHIMAKAQAGAPQAAPPVQARATSPDHAAQAGPHSEADRAEANARSNAKTAARAMANRAAIKVPATETNPHIEPHIAPSDSAPTDATQSDSKTSADGTALSADMAAWVAALNPACVNSSAAQASASSGEVAVAEFEMGTRLVTQAAGQTAADKNTQVLREDATGDGPHGRAHGVAGQRTTTDGSGPSAQSGRDSQQSPPRDSHDADAKLAATGAPTPTQGDLQVTTTAANAVAVLSKEVPSTTTDFSALMAHNVNTANASAGAPDSLSLSLPTPVNSPEFRADLSMQVSLLARDGVQTAELHLNPAEMGPVSIQIVMEGNQARVDFGADVAATRAAIEAGMPELASALLDAGFTLAGGGVSQHAKGQGQPDGEHRQTSTRRNTASTASSVANATAPPTQRRVQLIAGGVDLFA